jgi:hypothetical protein
MRTGRWSKVFVVAIVLTGWSKSSAQFTPGFLANDSYWSDGRAEFDIYDAQLMRAGELRHCEVIHIFTRDRIDPKTLARVDDAKRPDAIFAVRMQQIWNVPIGMAVEQGSLTAIWKINPLMLARLNFVGNDSSGNFIRRVDQNNLLADSDRDGSATIPLNSPANAVFYDELPVRVRTIDFRKSPAGFEIALAPSIISFTKLDTFPFAPAKVSWKQSQKSIEVMIQHAGGTDRFLLDSDFPFLLREWNRADGSRLKMKQGLKVDYWNYNKNGDRERALKNPLLRHPD